MLSTRDSPQNEGYTQTESKGVEKDISCKWNEKKKKAGLCSRKKEFLPFTTAWMEVESTMLREISQVAKGKYHLISSTTET